MNTASPTIEQIGSRKISRPDTLTPPRLHRYALFVACVTFLLVIAGGLVTSTGSSLAVPDWPLSNGQFFPKMEGGVFYEHGHRLIAGTVALLTFILAGWLWREEPRRGVRNLGLAAVGIICTQAVLGGVTVLYRLPAPISIAHACLGQIFFTVVVLIAVATGDFNATAVPNMKKLQRLGAMTVGFILFQLIAGATLRHTGKALHVHLLGAFLVVVHILLLGRRVLAAFSMNTGIARVAEGLILLVVAQLILGYVSWKTGPVLVTTAHVAIGALLLAGASVITLQAYRQQEASA